MRDAMNSDPLSVGAKVEGRYALVKQLGEGAFGEVWRAADQRLAQRAVAIKFLKPEHLDRPELVSRFESEAEALASLQHPNVVGVIDRGEWNGLRYIVTEFVEGRTLTAWIEEHRAERRCPDMATVVMLFDQIAAGVEAAHAVRTPGPIVHRDLKPDNVLVRQQSNGELVAKVLDFGIAQLGGRKSTRTGMLMGTPLYMAPEQAMGVSASVAPWTDVFALGVILVEMLTLRAQYTEGDTWWGTTLKRGGNVRDLLPQLRGDVPPLVWDVLARALRAEGADRYPDAGALRRALRRARAGQPDDASGAFVVQSTPPRVYQPTVAAPVPTPVSGPLLVPAQSGSPDNYRLNACGTECVALYQTFGVSARAMFNANDHWVATAPVGSFRDGDSPFEIEDMAGNVREWTSDTYTLSDGTTVQVVRGGGWDQSNVDDVRAARRMFATTARRDSDIGFRCVFDVTYN